jgi:hypothetical protein
MLSDPPLKQTYIKQDLQDWSRYWSAVNQQEYAILTPFRYNDDLRLVIPGTLPLNASTCVGPTSFLSAPCSLFVSRCSTPRRSRASVSSPTPFGPEICFPDGVLLPPTVKAAWRDNRRIADSSVLRAVLNEAGFRGTQLIADATDGDRSDWAREQLKTNTAEAVRLGLCGAPTYQFEDYLVWGQDRVNLVQGERGHAC